jgi:hypothetical protein
MIRLIDRFHCESDYLILRYKSSEMSEKIRNGAPGQCLKIEGNYFAISDVSEDTFDVMTKVDSCISNVVEPTVQDELLGKGFSSLDVDNAIVLTMGTGAGLGCYLTEFRKRKNLNTHFTAFVRGKTPIDQRISSLGNLWNTREEPRPLTPLYTVDIQELHPISSKTKIFPIGNTEFVSRVKKIMFHSYGMSEDCVITNF